MAPAARHAIGALIGLGAGLFARRSPTFLPVAASGVGSRGLGPAARAAGAAQLSRSHGAQAGLATLAAVGSFVARVALSRRGVSTARRAGEDLKGVLDVKKYFDFRPDDATKGFVMQQTMFRIKDPRRSLDFYTNVLGMRLITVGEFPQWGFSVYFVGYPPEKDLGPVPEDHAARFAYCMQVPGCVELTWNHGSEADASERVYNTGNSDATGSKDGQSVKGGFGHIGITVPDVYAACQRFKDLGVDFHKSPNSGGMKGLAFIKDPDGYLVEVLPLGKSSPFPTQEVDCLGVSLSGGGGYKDNSK